jgi:hypothetical protein
MRHTCLVRRNTKSGTNQNPPESTQIKFHYIKSNLFRVVHCDGFIGGPTPQGQFQIAFFNERAPIPQIVVHKVNPVTHELGDEVADERRQRDGIVREVEANLLMNLQTAKTLHKWLEGKIAETERLISESAGRTQPLKRRRK